MKCKFEFKPVEKTFSDPIAAVFKPGTPFGREYARGDIVLLHPEIASSKTFLNSNILRDALLDSREFLEEKLGIQIIDKREPVILEETKSTKSSKKQTKKKEVTDKVEVTEEVQEEDSLKELTIEDDE